ncbi:alpha-N-acetyl-neuraminyl-2,3-beta-galactosyl-1,3-N-acetyl-galactosaminide alpha-2,6-sialyltransferase-like [Ptychodera flava]|uniref:alpha-N-acetyl-neuraminyl-2,3-beta-galactosyl-1, 3-N-acetyl-galactosaminide alpha-2,6-sialyltransferase-like n=1 Tax=Ptychodera flava TaxID=63121 RepID=UPI003969C93F
MNGSPTVGYERDVGFRTTLRFVAHSAITALTRNATTLLAGTGKPKYIVVWGPPREMETSGRGVVYNYISKMQKENLDIEFYMLTNEQYEYAEHVFQIETGKSRYTSGSWLSTGLFTMVLLRKICDDIVIYGMVDSTYCLQNPKSMVPYHYFDPNGVKECAIYLSHEKAKEHGHRFLTEKYIFMSWGLKSYNISFRHPSSSAKTLDELQKTTFLKT